ncbi:MAG: copper homeostasis protein CutC [Paludibacteraceae bacterium]|nr:copper homeostasis protein CutC [Paludibacteraceae bacterium]
MKLEICATDIRSVLAAKEAGADRVELCSALEVGGLTPSEGLIRAAISTGIAVNVLIRPRPGDFVYNDDEIAVMVNDISRAFELGANGVVFGALTPEGNIDEYACWFLINAALGKDITFHRAIDRCNDIPAKVEKLVEMGFCRVLTSGGKATAIEGADVIREMVSVADGRLEIMAGSGVNSDNVRELISRTGVAEVHASAKGQFSEMVSLRNIVSSIV